MRLAGHKRFQTYWFVYNLFDFSLKVQKNNNTPTKDEEIAIHTSRPGTPHCPTDTQ